MSMIDPGITQTALTVMVVMMVAVVLNTLDRMIGRREFRDFEMVANGYSKKEKEK